MATASIASALKDAQTSSYRPHRLVQPERRSIGGECHIQGTEREYLWQEETVVQNARVSVRVTQETVAQVHPCVPETSNGIQSCPQLLSGVQLQRTLVSAESVS